MRFFRKQYEQKSGVKPPLASEISVAAAVAAQIPVGGIIMWAGLVSAIPAGWVLCDGANGAPDLRDKFVVGARQDDTGAAKTNVTGALTQSGGAATHTHEVDAGSFASGAGSAHAHSFSGVAHIFPNNDDKGLATQLVLEARAASYTADVYATGTSSDGADDLKCGTTSTARNYGASVTGTVGNEATHTHAVDVPSTTSGNNSTTAVPYYALAFIMKT